MTPSSAAHLLAAMTTLGPTPRYCQPTAVVAHLWGSRPATVVTTVAHVDWEKAAAHRCSGRWPLPGLRRPWRHSAGDAVFPAVAARAEHETASGPQIRRADDGLHETAVLTASLRHDGCCQGHGVQACRGRGPGPGWRRLPRRLTSAQTNIRLCCNGVDRIQAGMHVVSHCGMIKTIAQSHVDFVFNSVPASPTCGES